MEANYPRVHTDGAFRHFIKHTIAEWNDYTSMSTKLTPGHESILEKLNTTSTILGYYTSMSSNSVLYRQQLMEKLF